MKPSILNFKNFPLPLLNSFKRKELEEVEEVEEVEGPK